MSEFRQDPVTDRWVIIAPERAGRPTDFPAEDRHFRRGFCPFCEGHEDRTPPEVDCIRPANSPGNTPGWTVRVVPNRFPALNREAAGPNGSRGLFQTMNGMGIHEVIIETPRHVMSMSDMDVTSVSDLMRMVCRRLRVIREDTRMAHATVFKNVGMAAGASLEHAHSQLIATPVIPQTVAAELDGVRRFRARNGECVFCRILADELDHKERVVWKGRYFAAFAPFASRFPFETWILPLEHAARFEEQSSEYLGELAEVLYTVISRIDSSLSGPAYNVVIHTAPFRERDDRLYHWHVELMPRVTGVAGFEWGTGFHINPVAPERAAAVLARDPVVPLSI